MYVDSATCVFDVLHFATVDLSLYYVDASGEQTVRIGLEKNAGVPG
jgi:hypothetical protein